MVNISQKKLSALKSRASSRLSGARKSKKVKSTSRGLSRSIKGSVKDGLILTTVQNLVPAFAGANQPIVDKLIAGGSQKLLFKSGGSALIQVGLAEAVSVGLNRVAVPAVRGFASTGLTGLGSQAGQIPAGRSQATLQALGE